MQTYETGDEMKKTLFTLSVLLISLLVFGCTSTRTPGGIPTVPEDAVVAKCNKISGEVAKEGCFYHEATLKPDDVKPMYCLYVSNLSKRTSCLAYSLDYATGESSFLTYSSCQTAKLSEDYCKEINFDLLDELQKYLFISNIDDCYERYAHCMGTSWCEKIPNITKRDTCYTYAKP